MRISMISGMCHMDKLDLDIDYFFFKTWTNLGVGYMETNDRYVGFDIRFFE